tara:strand:- start:2832 stop:3176 length:345 start_codon:yes stop_codon:yes gene_type:complete
MIESGDSKILLQIGGLAAAIATAWGVTKATIKGILEQQQKDSAELASLNSRMDAVEATEAVQNKQLSTHAEISSVSNLDKRSRFEAATESRLRNLEKLADANLKLHNGEHPKTG